MKSKKAVLRNHVDVSTDVAADVKNPSQKQTRAKKPAKTSKVPDLEKAVVEKGAWCVIHKNAVCQDNVHLPDNAVLVFDNGIHQIYEPAGQHLNKSQAFLLTLANVVTNLIVFQSAYYKPVQQNQQQSGLLSKYSAVVMPDLDELSKVVATFRNGVAVKQQKLQKLQKVHRKVHKRSSKQAKSAKANTAKAHVSGTERRHTAHFDSENSESSDDESVATSFEANNDNQSEQDDEAEHDDFELFEDLLGAELEANDDSSHKHMSSRDSEDSSLESESSESTNDVEDSDDLDNISNEDNPDMSDHSNFMTDSIDSQDSFDARPSQTKKK